MKPAPEQHGSNGADRDPTLLNEPVVAELENLGDEVLSTLVSLFFDEAAGQVSELRGAIGRGEVLGVYHMAHKLKGGSSTLGAVLVSHIAAELETTAEEGDLTLADELVDRLHNALDETRAAFHSRVANTHNDGTDK
jgi:HPt (histidine-containing phosphotransfer) domain-containing protein